MCTYDNANDLEDLASSITDITYDLERAKDYAEDITACVREDEQKLEEIENHVCENPKYRVEQLLRADDGAQEENHAKLLDSLGQPQPVCPWCKTQVGIVYRQNEQYLLRCPCRVTYVQANSPVNAAKQLQLPGENK